MDVSTNIPVSGFAPSYKPPVTSTANTDPAPATADPQPTPAPAPAESSAPATPDIQAQYEEAIRQTALSFKDFYAISDKEFSIFKDASGQLITRYVSLRDGSITYTPAPVFIRNAQAAGGTIDPLQPGIEA